MRREPELPGLCQCRRTPQHPGPAVPVNAIPSASPNVPPGTVLDIATEDWRYGSHPLRLMVEFVRLDLSTYYDNQWVWISGQRLASDGTPLGHLDALVRVSALPCPDNGHGGSDLPGGADGRAAARNGSTGRTAPRQRTGAERDRRSSRAGRPSAQRGEPRWDQTEGGPRDSPGGP
ncbi:hypothetical protein [Plantactinospora sp. BC1]|uniref:hypothetical protein n=1 Tax=Plantactinospora sp. BC1 TaxID=2108470 RepID=UPI00131EE880|nr:hypothetical protein [Plantactinospora sp. BC1]